MLVYVCTNHVHSAAYLQTKPIPKLGAALASKLTNGQASCFAARRGSLCAGPAGWLSFSTSLSSHLLLMAPLLLPLSGATMMNWLLVFVGCCRARQTWRRPITRS